jgi:hypothetical protein
LTAGDTAILAALKQDDKIFAGMLEGMSGVEVGNETTGEGINVQNQYGVIVICDSESHQEQVYNELNESGYKVKVVVV